jgi:hypothetical protein
VTRSFALFLLLIVPAAAQQGGGTVAGRAHGFVPLSELAPVPLDPSEEKIMREVDEEICAAYRRWRSEGKPRRDHMEAWCIAGPERSRR